MEKFPKAAYSRTVVAPKDGYVFSVDTEGYGVASLLLGAGRNTKEDVINPAAGIYLKAKLGDFVKAGDPIAVLYTGDEARFAAAEKRLLEATVLKDVAPEKLPLVLDVVE